MRDKVGMRCGEREREHTRTPVLACVSVCVCVLMRTSVFKNRKEEQGKTSSLDQFKNR